MRILWDFRLFSYGYSERGVGVYTRNLAEAIIRENKEHTIVIWADKSCVPDYMKAWSVKWIPYKKSSWKKDMYHIPYLIFQQDIDLFHYWIALGPIHNIGMGAHHSCKVVATVYDLGVQLWRGVPFADSKITTWFWRTQKQLIRQCQVVFCISKATKFDLRHVIRRPPFKIKLSYPPIPSKYCNDKKDRKPYFITLGGSPHKNLFRVVEAFAQFKQIHSDFELVILGDVNKEIECPNLQQGLVFEDMERYSHHLQHSSGLIFCSLYEGLGIPPLEAASYHCPLLLSEIPSLKEVFDDNACFVNPENVSDIISAMEDLAINQKDWIVKSETAFEHYKKSFKNSVIRTLAVYKSLGSM